MVFERNTYKETSALLAKSVQVTNFMATEFLTVSQQSIYENASEKSGEKNSLQGIIFKKRQWSLFYSWNSEIIRKQERQKQGWKPITSSTALSVTEGDPTWQSVVCGSIYRISAGEYCSIVVILKSRGKFGNLDRACYALEDILMLRFPKYLDREHVQFF